MSPYGGRISRASYPGTCCEPQLSSDLSMVAIGKGLVEMVQLARDLSDPFDGFLRGKLYLIVDRDPLHTQAFREFLRSSGTDVMNLPPDAYVMNTYAERFVRTIRSECLDHLGFLGERSLVSAVRIFEKHYNSERNHQTVEDQLIRPDPQAFEGQGTVHCVEHLGGLLKFYRRKAA